MSSKQSLYDHTDTQNFERLVRLVAATFYEDEKIILLETLLANNYCLGEEVQAEGQRMMNNSLRLGRYFDDKVKDEMVRKILYSLKEERLICLSTAKFSNFQYWYIQPKTFCKVIELRLQKMDTIMKERMEKRTDKYICPNPECPVEYDEITLLLNNKIDANSFGCCDNCCIQDDHTDCPPTFKLVIKIADESHKKNENLKNRVDQVTSRIRKALEKLEGKKLEDIELNLENQDIEYKNRTVDDIIPDVEIEIIDEPRITQIEDTDADVDWEDVFPNHNPNNNNANNDNKFKMKIKGKPVYIPDINDNMIASMNPEEYEEYYYRVCNY